MSTSTTVEESFAVTAAGEPKSRALDVVMQRERMERWSEPGSERPRWAQPVPVTTFLPHLGVNPLNNPLNNPLTPPPYAEDSTDSEP